MFIGHFGVGFALGALVIELSIFGGGLWLYLRSTRARDRIGSVSLWALVGFLLLVYVGNVFGPPPADVAPIAWVGQAQWLLIALAYWIDRHRTVVFAS